MTNAPRTDALRLLADLFSESAHETWTKEEIINIIEDAIRLRGEPQRPQGSELQEALEAARKWISPAGVQGAEDFKADMAKIDAALAAPVALPDRETIAAALYAVEYDATTYEFRNAHEATRTILLKMADTAIAHTRPNLKSES